MLTKIRENQVKDLETTLVLIKDQIKIFKQPVTLFKDLPLFENENGDLRVCLEDGNIYLPNLSFIYILFHVSLYELPINLRFLLKFDIPHFYQI